MADAGPMELTCPRCQRTTNVPTFSRTLHAGNALMNVPLAAEDPDTPACGTCVTDIRERGAVRLPERRGWTDRVVRYETRRGFLADAVVAREDYPDPRGNILAEYVGPAPERVQPADAPDMAYLREQYSREVMERSGNAVVVLTYGSVELTERDVSDTVLAH